MSVTVSRLRLFARTLMMSFVGALLCPAVARAQSGTAVCYATADTRLEQKAPNTNYGDATRAHADKLWASCISGLVPGNLAEAALRFDLADRTACNLPTGVVVNAVRLTVNVGNATVDRFGLYQLKRPWTELGATWKVTGTGAAWQVAGANGTTAPGEDRNATLLASISNQPVGQRTIPFTTAGRDAVRRWHSSPASNHGVQLRSHAGDPVTSCDDSVWISSRETAARPRLEIDWAVADTVPPTISTIRESVGTTSATIQWTTSEAANGQVAYGTSLSYGMNTALSAGGLTTHSHTLPNLLAGVRHYYRVTSKDAAGNARTVTGEFTTQMNASAGSPFNSEGSTFKIVSWNLHYGKGMTTKAPGMSCPLPGMKDNAQCQRADDPNTLINEQMEERRRSAWGVGLTQRYLENDVLGDPEVIALLLTEVNEGTCFSQADLMKVVRTMWPNAAISKSHRDNWIVAKWGFVPGVANYGQRDIPPCGFKEYTSDGTLVRWPASDTQAIQWGRIYAENPDPDGDGVAAANPRVLNVFNAHWPHRGIDVDGTAFFCTSYATTTRDFMRAPAAGVDLSSEPRILGGDLNAEDLINTVNSSCEPYGGREGFDILRNAGLTDAYAAAAAPMTPTLDGATGMLGKVASDRCYTNYSHNGAYLPYKRIDYQWFTGGRVSGRNLRVVNFELIGVEQFGNCVPSDHMGTKVQYQWY